MSRPTKNPESLDGVPELTNLIYLEESDIAWNLQKRFEKQKNPYTKLGDIVIAMNPYQWFPIYGVDTMIKYRQWADPSSDSSSSKKQSKQNDPGPHVFRVAAQSLRDMVKHGGRQSVLLGGESGAGKTENAKQMIAYLLASDSVMSSIDKKIQSLDPLLEAFGNAKTVMNHNSSRFAKFCKLLYDPQNRTDVTAAKVETYLLEKSRVCIQGANERQYHSLVYLAKFRNKSSDHLGLDIVNNNNSNDDGHGDGSGIKGWNYLYGNGGHCEQTLDIPRNDRKEFEAFEQALETLEFTTLEKQHLLQSLSVVLHLGNITFKEKSQSDETAQINDKDQSKEHLQWASKLIGLNDDNGNNNQLERILTHKTVRVGMESIESALTVENSKKNRDSMAKHLYATLFEYIVKRCNQTLGSESSSNKKKSKKKQLLSEKNSDECWIGILDIFGFERFESNSLEQLFINVTNEMMQHHFAEKVIKSEQEEYLRERLPWIEVKLPNNNPFTNLIFAKKAGLFAHLNSACQMPKGSPQIFLHSLMKSNKSNKHLKKPKNRMRYEKDFTLLHYAGNVDYDCTAFLTKNTDTLFVDSIKLFESSQNNSIILNAFKQSGSGSGSGSGSSSSGKSSKIKSTNKKSFNSLANRFDNKIHALLEQIMQSKSWFVRCLNPNKVKSTTEWDTKHVCSQLQCNGITDASRIVKLGYPTRINYSIILDSNKFQNSLNQITSLQRLLQSNSNIDRLKVSAILSGLDIPSEYTAFGITKVFFKFDPSGRNFYEEIIQHSGNFNESEQKRVEHFVAEMNARRISAMMRTMVVLKEKIIRRRLAKEMIISQQLIQTTLGVISQQSGNNDVNRQSQAEMKEPSPDEPDTTEVDPRLARKRKEHAVKIHKFLRFVHEKYAI